MTPPLLSKPLWVLLLATAATSLVLSLRPDAVESEGQDLLATPHADQASPVASGPVLMGQPWRREMTPLPKVASQPAKLPMPVTLPPPPPPSPVVVAPVEPVVEKPRAPSVPFAYVGRMMQDGKSRIFLSQGEHFLVVEAGENIDASWKVEGVTDEGLRLRYLPLNELKVLGLNH